MRKKDKKELDKWVKLIMIGMIIFNDEIKELKKRLDKNE